MGNKKSLTENLKHLYPSPLKVGYYKDKTFDYKKPRLTVEYRKSKTIPVEGRPYTTIGEISYLTGYSFSFIRYLYLKGDIRGYQFPKCTLKISLSDFLLYIDSIARYIEYCEIQNLEVSPGLKRRAKKALKVKKNKEIFNDPEYKKYKEKLNCSNNDYGDKKERRIYRKNISDYRGSE